VLNQVQSLALNIKSSSSYHLKKNTFKNRTETKKEILNQDTNCGFFFYVKTLKKMLKDEKDVQT